jgi:hypothetical protein
MTPHRTCVLALVLLGAATAAGRDAAPPRYADRWFYASHNLLVDKNVDALVALIERAGKSGYNGVVLADYKFNILGLMPPQYFANARRVRQAADAAGLQVIPTVFPVGNPTLAVFAETYLGKDDEELDKVVDEVFARNGPRA